MGGVVSPKNVCYFYAFPSLKVYENPMTNKLFFIAVAITACFAITTRAAEPERLLFSFGDAANLKQWQTVNDGVMGGRSVGRMRHGSDGTLNFYGTLSLANNGGQDPIKQLRCLLLRPHAQSATGPTIDRRNRISARRQATRSIPFRNRLGQSRDRFYSDGNTHFEVTYDFHQIVMPSAMNGVTISSLTSRIRNRFRSSAKRVLRKAEHREQQSLPTRHRA